MSEYDNGYDEGYRFGMQKMREFGHGRIEELEEQNKRLRLEVAHANDTADVAIERVEELEDNLAKAVAGMMALTDVSTLMQSSSSHNRFRHNTTVTDSIWSQWSTQLKFARTTLAELTGGKDE